MAKRSESPPDEEPGFAELELSRADWQIVCGAVMLLAKDADGSDIERVKALSAKLDQFKTASGAVVEVWE